MYTPKSEAKQNYAEVCMVLAAKCSMLNWRLHGTRLHGRYHLQYCNRLTHFR